MENIIFNCKIADIGVYLPPSVIDNMELSSRYEGWDKNKIYEKTGIHKRHIASNDEHVSDLAVSAAKTVFNKGYLQPDDVDALILCTQTPDYALPGSSCIVHERLGLSKKCITFDFNQGCTGFIYGLYIAGAMIHSGSLQKILLITSETYSRWCHPMDKSVTTIFGDGAAAIYLKLTKDEYGIGPFVFGTDGRGFQNLIVPYSGSHRIQSNDGGDNETTDESGNIRTLANLYMNGPELFRFAMGTVPSLVKDILGASKISFGNIDKFVFHQANFYMLKNIQKMLRIPDSKMIYEIEDVGNTVSASIPIALKRAYEKGSISVGEKLLLSGFGVGYSWAGTILTWNPDVSKNEI